MSEKGIKIIGYLGRWHEIDRETFEGITYVLYEEDELGDLTCGVVVDITNNKVICDTFDNIECALVDEGIIDIDKLHGGEY